jgi:hypothetical protein
MFINNDKEKRRFKSYIYNFLFKLQKQTKLNGKRKL